MYIDAAVKAIASHLASAACQLFDPPPTPDVGTWPAKNGHLRWVIHIVTNPGVAKVDGTVDRMALSKAANPAVLIYEMIRSELIASLGRCPKGAPRVEEFKRATVAFPGWMSSNRLSFSQAEPSPAS